MGRVGAWTVCCVVALILAALPADGQQRSFNGVPLSPNVTCNTSDCRGYNVQPYVRVRSKYGTGCLGNVPPGTTPRPDAPPQSYLFKDAGKRGYPALTPSELAMARRIQHYVRSDTLRIAWVYGGSRGREFIVFDALDGPCKVEAAGYPVLNGAYNEYYQPGENPYWTHAAPSDGAPSRPWMANP